MKYAILLLILMTTGAIADTTCYYTNGKTVCCWDHVNGKDKVCN
jgi:hypothetical protein